MKIEKVKYDELIEKMMKEADRLERLEDCAFGPYRKTLLTDTIAELRMLVNFEFEEEE